MGMTKPDQLQSIDIYRSMGIFDHFADGFSASSSGKWNTTATGSGASIANNDGAGGILTLTTGATINNEACVFTPKKIFQFLSVQPQFALCSFYYTEGNVNQAGIAFGLASSWSHILADTTFALPSTLSGALIYKKPGDTLWSAWGSVGTTQSNQQSLSITQLAGIPQYFVIYAMMDQASNVELTFQQLPIGYTAPQGSGPWMLPNTTGMSRMQPIKFYIPYASALGMQLGLFVKSGDGTSEVVSLDCIGGGFLSIP